MTRFLPHRSSPWWICLVALLSVGSVWAADEKDDARRANTIWAEIRVIDAETGRGVPLAELETVNGLKFVTDNDGRVAFHEPGLLGRVVFFNVRSHGYEMPKDGFGFAGARIAPRVGETAVVKLKRLNAAERLCRLTGEGLWRDSVLLGYKDDTRANLSPGLVAGQDSVQAIVHNDRVYWFWGDTLQMKYPLGLFRMAGATTPVFDPNDPKSDPAHGIPLEYFVDQETGFARAMMPLPERPEGVVWVSALFELPDENGEKRIVAHYSRRKGLAEELEQGIALFDDDKHIFESVKQLPPEETWRHPSGHPIMGSKWILFGSPTPNVRVPARLADVLDPEQYEAFTCAKAGSDPKNPEPDLNDEGQPNWRWQSELPPTDSKTEHRWITEGKLKGEYARFCPANAADPSERVVLHSGTVRWNPYRRRFILLAGQIGGKPSFLGEVWYAEAMQATGPFRKAVRVVTHDKQTFYNVCHHAFLDREEGRVIHFEGTYTNDFSGNPDKTPRYNYNQVLYRLDLDNPALKRAQETDPPGSPR